MLALLLCVYERVKRVERGMGAKRVKRIEETFGDTLGLVWKDHHK